MKLFLVINETSGNVCKNFYHRFSTIVQLFIVAINLSIRGSAGGKYLI
jgi:hypothetical protein